jgi:hypothetical protein
VQPAGPVLVTVDDVQWADLATTQALRSMPRLLASSPLSWILAVGTSSDAGPAGLLFGLPKAAEYLQRLPALGHYYPSPYLTDGVRLWRPMSWRPAAGRGRRWTSWPTCWPACQSTSWCC